VSGVNHQSVLIEGYRCQRHDTYMVKADNFVFCDLDAANVWCVTRESVLIEGAMPGHIHVAGGLHLL
jgi:hypothetical protein